MNKLAAAAVLLLASTSVAVAQGTTPEPAPVPTTTTTTTTVVVTPGATVVTPAPAPAAAGPATTAPASGAPQTHDWNNVNNINGQLVKVGETNDYLKTYKRWNVSTNPIGMILGFYGVSVSYGINNNIAIRGDINYMNPGGQDDETGIEIGVGVPIYFRRTYQGLFLEPGFISRTFSDSYCDEYGGSPDYSCLRTTEETQTTFGPQMLVGWHWTWESGLNFALAAGAGRDWSNKDTDYDPGVFANGYMRFGYAF